LDRQKPGCAATLAHRRHPVQSNIRPEPVVGKLIT
jgi:hypothetical protein